MSRSARRTLIPVALTVLAGCKETLEVFPGEIQIPKSTSGPVTFEAYARLRNKKGEIKNDVIQWQSNAGPAVSFNPNVGRYVTIKVNPAVATTYTVTVKSKGKTDELKIRVVASANDQAIAKPDLIPSVVALFGNGTACPSDSTYAFVGAANIGDRGVSCLTTKGVFAFTAYRPPVRGPGSWTDGDDAVDAIYGDPGLKPEKIKIWRLDLGNLNGIAPDPTDPAGFADLFISARINTALGIFLTNRVGVTLSWDNSVTYLNSSAASCPDLHAFLDPDTDGTPESDRWQHDAINIYIVRAGTSNRAQYCWVYGSNGPKNVLRLQTDALTNTLAHELGHVFGLYVPWGPGTPPAHTGHVDAFNGFAVDNVMYAGVNTTTTAARTRLSIGQVYRMHFDKRSRLAPASPADCGCDPYGTMCSLLSRDVRAIKDASGTLGAASLPCEP